MEWTSTIVIYGLLFWGGLTNYIYAQEKAPQERESQIYFYQNDTGVFGKIAKTTASADSVLNSSWDHRNTDLNKALSNAKLGLSLAQSLNYKAGIARAHFLLGLTNQRVGAHEPALKHFHTALDMEKKRGDNLRIGKVLNGIAIFHFRQEHYESAIEYFKRSLKMMQEIGNREREAVSTANLGLIYFEKEQYKQSLQHFKRALKIFEDAVDNEFAKYATMTNMANSYLELGAFMKTKDYLLQSLAYFKEHELVSNQSEIYLSLSKLYLRLGKEDKALQYAQNSLYKAQKTAFRESIIEAYRQMAAIHEAREEYQKAYNFYQKFNAVQDSLLNSERIATIKEMEIRFDVEQKNRKIELLNKEAALQQAQLDRQKLWRIFMIIALGLLGVIAGLLYRYNNQKKQANHLLEQKNREIAQQNQQLLKLNEEKDEFLGVAAHDLRNPLTGITSVVSLMKQEQQLSDEELEEYIRLIAISSDRMLTLINNLLDVNMIEEGGRDLEFAAVDVRGAVNRVIAGIENEAADKKITISSDIDHKLPSVLAEEEALQRVLENLISNAVKYSDPGMVIDISSQVQGEWMEISVMDSGPGIAEDEQDQLFKRFCRLSTAPTGNESSTGLGLYIVKKLVEKMNGHVRCESKAGEGATFIISLQIYAAEKV